MDLYNWDKPPKNAPPENCDKWMNIPWENTLGYTGWKIYFQLKGPLTYCRKCIYTILIRLIWWICSIPSFHQSVLQTNTCSIPNCSTSKIEGCYSVIFNHQNVSLLQVVFSNYGKAPVREKRISISLFWSIFIWVEDSTIYWCFEDAVEGGETEVVFTNPQTCQCSGPEKKTASLPPGNSIRLEDELFLFGAFQTYVQGCFLLLVPGFPGVHWFKKISTQVGLNNRLHIRPDFGAFYRLSLQGMVETTFGSAQGVCFFGWDGVLGGASESFFWGGNIFLDLFKVAF